MYALKKYVLEGIMCMILIWMHPSVIDNTIYFIVNLIDPYVT